MEQVLKEYETFLSIIYNKHAAKMKTGLLSMDDEVFNAKQSFIFEQELEDKGKFRRDEILRLKSLDFNPEILATQLDAIYERCLNNFLKTYFKHLG